MRTGKSIIEYLDPRTTCPRGIYCCSMIKLYYYETVRAQYMERSLKDLFINLYLFQFKRKEIKNERS